MTCHKSIGCSILTLAVFVFGAPHARPQTNSQTVPIAPASPANGATNISGSPVLGVTLSAPETPNLTVTFHGRAVASKGAGPDFTIIAVPDTQFYVSRMRGGLPEMFTRQTDWIVSNRLERNIAFVTQLGDCTQHGDNGGTNTEWLHATNALYRLEDPVKTKLPEGIPYGVAVGNHDQSPETRADGTTTFYNEFFGEKHFAGKKYYGGHYGTNNDNSFVLFSASGLDFIAVHLEYDTNANSPAIQWANEVLQKHQNRRAIVVSHWLMNPGFNGRFSAQGRAVYNALRGNTNLFLMLCGHMTPEEGQRSDAFEGRTVWTLMSDYQSRTNGGSGWLRIYTFSPTNNVIRAQTYSPWLDRFETDANSQFEIPYQLSPTNAFSVIASGLKVQPGGGVSAPWANLPPGAAYEWFATASDGTNTLTTPVWKFSTAAR